MDIDEVSVFPPLKEWSLPGTRDIAKPYLGHVALKRMGRGWEGFGEAVEPARTGKRLPILPGSYWVVPAEELPVIIDRLGDNARRVIIRRVKDPDPPPFVRRRSADYIQLDHPWTLY